MLHNQLNMSLHELSHTQNGATALKTSGDNIVDYFMMFTRTLPKHVNEAYLEKCWADNPEKTVATIFNGRDRVQGKKEKKVSNEAMMWLRSCKPETYKLNMMNYINKYGCWKDLLYISYHNKSSSESVNKSYELQLFADQLLVDKNQLVHDQSKSVSLCAKWAPSENDRNDTRKHFAKKLASLIYSREDTKKMEKYRKEILVPLRKKINIVERLMCNNEWDQVQYEHVPGVASKRLLKAFMKHDEERYRRFLEAVKKGEKEIKITGLLPHELAKYYIDNDYTENRANETIELQWRAMLENVRKDGTLKNALAIIDVSGSMFSASNGSIPAQVAIALGILTSLCCEPPFNKRFITFSHNPQLATLDNENLFDAYKSIRHMEYGYNTDFVKCCECIIQYGVKNKIADEDMPKKLFVFTDMQFDRASPKTKDLNTIYQHITKMFVKHEYTPPKFIFWNLNSDHQETFPVDCSVENTAMVSGFSEQLLKIFMKYDDFNPMFIVDEILQPYMKDVVICNDEVSV